MRSDDAVDTSVPRVLALENAAVSTAGSAEQHVDADGRRYSHIVDPASRMGLVDDITVTVIAQHGIDADGLDTAVSVVGAQRGLALDRITPVDGGAGHAQDQHWHDLPAVDTVPRAGRGAGARSLMLPTWVRRLVARRRTDRQPVCGSLIVP